MVHTCENWREGKAKVEGEVEDVCNPFEDSTVNLKKDGEKGRRLAF